MTQPTYRVYQLRGSRWIPDVAFTQLLAAKREAQRQIHAHGGEGVTAIEVRDSDGFVFSRLEKASPREKFFANLRRWFSEIR